MYNNNSLHKKICFLQIFVDNLLEALIYLTFSFFHFLQKCATERYKIPKNPLWTTASRPSLPAPSRKFVETSG